MASSAEIESCCINDLPDLVLLKIFSYLPIDERSPLEETCKLWLNLNRNSSTLAFSSIVHLHSFVEQPISSGHVRLGRVLTRWSRPSSNKPKANNVVDPRPYGYIQQYLKRFQHSIRHLYIDVEQHDVSCRYVLCQILSLFGQEKCPSNRLINTFRLRFIGTNPLFLKSLEILQGLRVFFEYDSSRTGAQSLVSCDLSGLTISLDDDTVLSLAKNNPRIRKLNLQDQSLVCILTPFCLLQILDMLPELEDLWVDMVSLTDEFLLTLIGTDDDETSIPRFPLRHLGIRVRREEKFSDEIDYKLWQRLRQKYPNLTVTLNFDLTTPLNRLRAYMDENLQLPVQTLIMNSAIPLVDEICLAANSFSETLEVFHIRTSGQWAAMTRTPSFNRAIIYVVCRCVRLKRFYVDAALEQETIDQAFEINPGLQEPGASKLLLIETPTHNITPDDMAELFG